MKIDFSWSLDDWKKVFDEFLKLVSNFLAAFGIKLFPDSGDYDDSWDIVETTTKAEATTAE